jgi:parvulin-like peptidyl-prolyl isomerase
VKRELAALIIAAACLSGCNSQSPPPPDDIATAATQTSVNPPPKPAEEEVVATIRGEDITLKELNQPLIASHGLTILLELVQLDLAKQDAQRQNIAITQADIDSEATKTLLQFRRQEEEAQGTGGEPTSEPSDDSLAPDDREKLMALILRAQRITRAEFDIGVERNAYLRKLVAPQVASLITEDLLRDRFNAIYGERARVRFIRLPDMMTVSKVAQELKAGMSFEDEMRLHAYDSVGRASVGTIPPFSRKDAEYPVEFREVVFGLKPGQISDPVQIKDSIYLVQLIELIPPRHAKFEDYEASLRQTVYEDEVQAGMKQYLQSLGDVALQTMEIKDPALKQQWDQNLHSAEELQAQMQRERATLTTTRPVDAETTLPSK